MFSLITPHFFTKGNVLMFDYLIVGNSILGLMTAYRLTQFSPNATIAIVGSSNRTGGATISAGAMLGVFGEVTNSIFSSDLNHRQFQYAHQNTSLWFDLIDELNDQVELEEQIKIHPNGTFILLNAHGTSKDDTPNYHAILRALKESEEPHTELEPKDVPGLCPEERARSIRSVYIPGEHSIKPIAVLNLLEKVLLKTGNVEFINQNAIELVMSNASSAQIDGVKLKQGNVIKAGNVVVAAGVGSQQLIDSLPVLKGRIPYLMSGDGVSYLLDQSVLGEHKIEHVIRTPNRAGACGLHVVPNIDEPNSLYMGAGNMVQWESLQGASMESANWIMGGGMQEINKHLADARIRQINQGNRPTPIDGFPLLGASSSVNGLWFLTGTGRDGFHRSPLLSSHLVKKMLGENNWSTAEANTLSTFEQFAPERPLIELYSQDDAIKLMASEIDCALHETGGLLTTGLHAPFPDWLSNDIRNIYQELDTSLALQPMVIFPIVCRRWKPELVKSYLESHKQAWG